MQALKNPSGLVVHICFNLFFCLIFQQKNWFSLLESKKVDQFPAKDSVYRFLNQSTFNWRRFLLLLSTFSIHKVERLTDKSRPKVFIVDDSSFDRNRFKKVECWHTLL